MPRVFRKTYTLPIPEDAQHITHKGKPAVRFKDKDGKAVIAFLTKNGDRCRCSSPKWYGWVNGAAVPLCTNKSAAELMLAELMRKAERAEAGLGDPFEKHRKRPLDEHLADFRRELEARGNAPRYVQLVFSRLTFLMGGCGFVFTPDLSASRAMDWLAELRRRGRPRAPLPAGQESFTSREAAALLGIKPLSVGTAVRRLRLEATGQGKARRFPRATLEALQERLARGTSMQTTNDYRSALKSFGRWLVPFSATCRIANNWSCASASTCPYSEDDAYVVPQSIVGRRGQLRLPGGDLAPAGTDAAGPDPQPTSPGRSPG
jgi:hypothetical protein